MWLYDGEKGYDLPIHSADNMLQGFTFQHIMDIAAANYGYPLTEENLIKTIKEELEKEIEDMWENWEICKDKMTGN